MPVVVAVAADLPGFLLFQPIFDPGVTVVAWAVVGVVVAQPH
ncbi:MAG TPA: hypothetical protein VFN75_08870 [Pseudonocardiaceae bacterium]|nr:hypothetical protein [Pseudonocardiaceae bacterium]